MTTASNAIMLNVPVEKAGMAAESLSASAGSTLIESAQTAFDKSYVVTLPLRQ